MNRPENHQLTKELVANGRLVVERCLGSGGSGTVYAAIDVANGTTVAVKKLSQRDPMALYRFKQEFRALADLRHENLVRLQELFVVDGQWYLTMDLVDGVDFTSYVRPMGVHTALADTEEISPAPGLSAATMEQAAAGLGKPDVQRLRQALAGLTTAVRALHDAGKLHRDLKPSNVLVTSAGRVVVLDFGLVADLSPLGPHETFDGGVRGTPAYMAPEQAAGAPVGPEADWYAVGVMLFEALTGQLPLLGHGLHVLRLKQEVDAPDPRRLWQEAPEDLVALCRDLLERDPARRPRGEEIGARLGKMSAAPPHPTSPVWVGRSAELAQLRAACADVAPSHPVIAHIMGASGLGKTALVRAFLEPLRARADTTVLCGRCYERESMPYKAIDGLIDALALYLGRLTEVDAAVLLPRSIGALTCLFPTLLRVRIIEQASRTWRRAGDPLEIRRLGVAAVRELLLGLADRGTVVLHIDDIHWGDEDSAEFLLELLSPPDPPAVLLLLGYRQEAIGRVPFVRRLLNARAIDSRAITLSPLPGDEARALAASLIPEADAGSFHSLIAEAGGSPLLIKELARLARAGGPVTLEQAIGQRLDGLSTGARGLLAVVAIAAGPLPVSVARSVVQLQEFASAVREARDADLMVRWGTVEEELLEISHDRLRETLVERLPQAQRCEIHARLAQALEESGAASPEQLASHYRAAGDVVRAAMFYEQAAERAERALAFERGAELLRIAVALASEPAQPALRRRLGEVLALAGRPREAAHTYLACIRDAGQAESRALRRTAAEHLLRGGYLDEGLALLRVSLAEVGLAFPETPGRALAVLVWRRLRLRARGLEVKPQAPRSGLEVERMDVCFAAGLGLANTDMVRGMGYLSQHLLLALDQGDPVHLVRALSLEALFIAGSHDIARAEVLERRAEDLCARANDPRTGIWPALARGAIAVCRYRYRTCVEEMTAALDIAARHGAGSWELGTAQFFLVNAHHYLGDLHTVARRVADHGADARARGDLYAEITVRISGLFSALLRGAHADEVEREADDIMARWKNTGFHMQHVMDLLVRTWAAMCRGDGSAAWGLISARWPQIERSQLLRIRSLFVRATEIRAHAALAAGTPEALADAGRLAAVLLAEDCAYPRAIGATVRASLLLRRGPTEEPLRLLGQALGTLEAAELAIHAHVVRRFIGHLRGGAEGREVAERSEAALCALGVAHPDLATAVLAPGDRPRPDIQ